MYETAANHVYIYTVIQNPVLRESGLNHFVGNPTGYFRPKLYQNR